MQPYKKSLKKNARNLRNHPTDAELKLWLHLRHKQILETQFNRQKPILNYIVDFYCAKARLVIELDGDQHMEPINQLKDQKRDKALKELGLTVLRFSNREVLMETDSVLSVIYATVEAKSPPTPLC